MNERIIYAHLDNLVGGARQSFDHDASHWHLFLVGDGCALVARQHETQQRESRRTQRAADTACSVKRGGQFDFLKYRNTTQALPKDMRWQKVQVGYKPQTN